MYAHGAQVNVLALDVAQRVYAAHEPAANVRDRGGNYPHSCASTREMRELMRSWQLHEEGKAQAEM